MMNGYKHYYRILAILPLLMLSFALGGEEVAVPSPVPKKSNDDLSKKSKLLPQKNVLSDFAKAPINPGPKPKIDKDPLPATDDSDPDDQEVETSEFLPISEVLVDHTEEEAEEEQDLPNYAYLGQFLKPWENVKRDKLLTLNFENAELINLIKYYEKEYGITFILDSVVQPMEGGKNPVGTKFSFKTEVPFNKKQAWDLFVTFLEMAGLKVIPGPVDKVYQITSNDPQSRFATAKDPVPTFIGIDPVLLPEADFIRYVYFIQNATPKVISSVADTLKSNVALRPLLVEDLNALIMTDKASNIRSILAILKELDKPVLPESLTIIKLQKVDATKVKDLYNQLVSEEKTLLQRLSPGGRRQSGVSLFTENVRVFADPRTNSLIILGPRANVQRIEDFIKKEIDKDVDLPYSPLHVYQLKFIDAETTAQILTELKNFQPPSAAGATQYGGIIGGTKYLKPTVSITAEKSTNSLIINADYDDYLQIFDLLQKIDTEQPQAAIRVLVLDVSSTDIKLFGSQLRNRVPTLDNVLSEGVNFQTSGLPLSDTSSSSLVLNPFSSSTETPDGGATRLLGNLANLLSSNIAGSTVLTLGTDAFGIWGLLKVLQTYTNTTVVSKPFIVTTHKYTAQISIEEVRKVLNAQVVSTPQTPVDSFGDLAAGLTLNITPQISPDGLITLAVTVDSSQFTQTASVVAADDPSQGNRNDKKITTSVIVENNQVLALGGLTRDNVTESEVKVPILGDIPLLGWLFKSRTKVVSKSNLLVLISAEIINPRDRKIIQQFTDAQLTREQNILDRTRLDTQQADPINRWFFETDRDPLGCHMKSFDKPYAKPVEITEPIVIHDAIPGRGKRARRASKRNDVSKVDAEIPVDPNIQTTVTIKPPQELSAAGLMNNTQPVDALDYSQISRMNYNNQKLGIIPSQSVVTQSRPKKLEDFVQDAGNGVAA